MNRKWIGQEIRRLRKDKKLTGVALAQLLGITSQAIYQYELGKREIPTLYLVVILMSFMDKKDFFRWINQVPGISRTEIRQIVIITNHLERSFVGKES